MFWNRRASYPAICMLSAIFKTANNVSSSNAVFRFHTDWQKASALK